ncbi:rab-GTPase-TBC domain-containing protein [Phakopsora pachyrhizi]|nr:rab-GTPase-TBC domain-containing protein [Phakopsora pachyrhizi]
MAPPPRPAEKSRAGKRALAAIQGGGGLGVRGPKASILQRVISRTRPKDLPPKAPEEDQKHLKEFSEMMAASLETRKREASLEIQRKLAREQMIASYQPTWEKEVLPNWKTVLRDDQSGKELRKMWWLGTMPPRHRGRLWHQCIGNAGAVGRSAYMKSVSLAKSLMSSTPSRFPDDVLRSIDEDISRTLPRLKLFQEDRPMHSDFRQVLLAWSVFWRERPYYPTGSSHVAALLLINMPPADAFLSLVNLTRKSCLSYFYNQKVSEIEGFYRIFENLFSESMPKLYKNFRERRLLPSFYLEPWIRSVYISHLPLELSTRIMDVFVLEGDSFLFRVALTILETLEARLYNPDRLELEAVLTGTDRGSRLLVVRNQMLKQGSNVERSIDDVGVDESYEEMGCDEERIFKSLNERSWNENLWDRLVARELPD